MRLSVLYKKEFRLVLLLFIYFTTRFYNLTLLPIFTDEAIYIFWAKYIATAHSHWFISLTDGKPPLLIWTMAGILTLLPHDLYLFAGRLSSVAAGAISVIGLFFLAKQVFQSLRVSFITSLLYIIAPFTLFYDRLALFDSLLSAMLIWSLYFALKTSRTCLVKDALLWGLFLGLGFLSKPTAIIFLFLTPIIAFLYQYKNFSWQANKKIVFLSILAIVLSQMINNLQRLSSAFPQAAIKNQQFQQPLNDLIAYPFALIDGNLRGLFSWIIAYYTMPLFILGIGCFLLLFLLRPKISSMLFSLWFLPIIAFATVGRELFPRYILFTTPYFFIPIAYVIHWLLLQKTIYKVCSTFLACIIFYPSLAFGYSVITNPINAPLPSTDYHQYITDHPSGYGLDKVFSFLHNEEQKGKLTLFTQGTFGLYPYAFNLEFWDNKNIKIFGKWPLDKIDDDILNEERRTKVFILFKEYNMIPKTLPVEVVLKVEKPSKRYSIFITKLKPI